MPTPAKRGASLADWRTDWRTRLQSSGPA